jgi:hypothetical protein
MVTLDVAGRRAHTMLGRTSLVADGARPHAQVMKRGHMQHRSNGPDTSQGIRGNGQALADRPHAVIEHADGAWQAAAARALERAGYDVACCGGPSQLPRGRCPLIEGRGCALIEGADVIVNGLGLHDPANRTLIEALRSTHPAVPLVVEAPRSDLASFADELDGSHTVPFPVRSSKVLVEIVTDAVERGT